ncbi:MAG: integrase, partial [Candidatus Azotimanducaceae bacterium]
AERQEAQKNQVWTFKKCAEAYISAHEPSWKNKKHAQQWRNTLTQYANPVFGDLPVEEISTQLVMQAIEPIWQTKTETASRVRGRIERVLSWAIVNEYRPHPNPALWRGNLMELLAAPAKIARTVHHPALPYQQIDSFVQSLGEHESTNAKALYFTILTACRTSEVLGASWNEIDFSEETWTIPANRMKSERPHRVPLSKQAIELLNGLDRENNWLFPSPQYGKHLSNMAMLNLLKKQLGYSDLTIHGFRSTFRDWVAEQTTYQRELAEAALAHVLGDKTEAAYQRGDMLEKRAELMQDWANYVSGLANEASPN